MESQNTALLSSDYNQLSEDKEMQSMKGGSGDSSSASAPPYQHPLPAYSPPQSYGYPTALPLSAPPVQSVSQNNINVVINQPGFQRPPQNVREWSTGLFDCCSDCGTCCCVLFCSCCVTTRIATRLGEDCCCLGCCCLPMSMIPLRTKLRTLYGIRGSICKDYCAVHCCYDCVLCQMSRELDHVGL